MSKTIKISSQSHLDRVLSTTSYVVADFYADWCAPCKAIAPLFEQLSSTESKAGRLAFVKIDVDTESGVARKYGVSAMPTFLVLRKDTVVKTIRGADPNSLRSAVSEVAKQAAASTFSSSSGQVLGSSSEKSKSSNYSSGQPYSVQGFISAVIRFIMLYLTTLLSLDPVLAAQSSPYSKTQR
ncbi:MAG: hypothetical protein LQ340_004519 [Diploschistes diacapsis]|nr:MAG: hypothetical protein LQ340_004519 [Diploschistes diacapsis]